MTLPSTARDTRPPVDAPSRPRSACAAPGCRSASGRSGAASTSTSSPASSSRCSGPTGRARPRWCACCSGCSRCRAGEVRVAGREPRRGSPHIGYIPQQKALDPDLPLRGRDLVGLGLDGHRLGHRLPRAAGAPGPGGRGAGRGRRHGLRGRAGRAPLRRRAAAAAGGPGAGRRPGGAAVRRAAALARPGPPGQRHRADRPAAAGGRHRGRVRHPRDQPDPAAGGPGAVPGGRPLPDRADGRGDDLGGAVGAVRHAGRRAARARPAGRGRGGRRGRGALPRGRTCTIEPG